MRGGLLWGAARVLWAGRAVGAARRPLSCSSPPLEELFARGGPLRTFLERQAGSEAQLRVKGPELVAVTKLLSEKERELRETEHLLHGKGRTRGAASERIVFPPLPFPLSHWPGVHTTEFEALN